MVGSIDLKDSAILFSAWLGSILLLTALTTVLLLGTHFKFANSHAYFYFIIILLLLPGLAGFFRIGTWKEWLLASALGVIVTAVLAFSMDPSSTWMRLFVNDVSPITNVLSVLCPYDMQANVLHCLWGTVIETLEPIEFALFTIGVLIMLFTTGAYMLGTHFSKKSR